MRAEKPKGMTHHDSKEPGTQTQGDMHCELAGSPNLSQCKLCTRRLLARLGRTGSPGHHQGPGAGGRGLAAGAGREALQCCQHKLQCCRWADIKLCLLNSLQKTHRWHLLKTQGLTW